MQQFVGVGSVSAQVGNIIGTYNHTLGLYLPLLVNSVQLIGNFSAVFLLKTMGRRTVALLGNGGVGLIDLTIAVLFLFIDDGNGVIIAATIFLILYMLLFGLTLGPIVWLYVPEIIPASMVPYATMDNWIAATIVYSMTPMVVGAFDGNPSVLFFIFTGLTFFFFVINFIFMV
jgi:SP family arabinose:H+ symporter-like MFS transporter